MSTETHQITVNDITVDVVRKDIKNLHLGVYPPDGRVRVAAPFRVDDEVVRLAVITRLSWIRRQQAKFAGQERQSPREYVSRESHYYLGDRYLLNILYNDRAPKVTVRNNRTIDLVVRPDSDAAQRERVLIGWYRARLKQMIPPLIAKWEPVIGVEVAEWGVKQMKTRWGACNPKVGRIWLNLELVKKPADCLEYVLVHEMVHLLERTHNARFVGYMDQFLPRWRELREVLNQAPLGHATWDF